MGKTKTAETQTQSQRQKINVLYKFSAAFSIMDKYSLSLLSLS